MSLLSTLGKIGLVVGKTALSVATKSNPVVGAVVDTVLATVIEAESVWGSKKGAEKKELALNKIHLVTPDLITLVESFTHKDVVKDHAMFAGAVDQLIDGVVTLLNSMRQLEIVERAGPPVA